MFLRCHKGRDRHPDKALSAAFVRTAAPGRHADGNGLYLFRPVNRKAKLGPTARHPWSAPRAWIRCRCPCLVRRNPPAGARQPQVGAVRPRPAGRESPRQVCSHGRGGHSPRAQTEARRMAQPVAHAELLAEPRTPLQKTRKLLIKGSLYIVLARISLVSSIGLYRIPADHGLQPRTDRIGDRPRRSGISDPVQPCYTAGNERRCEVDRRNRCRHHRNRHRSWIGASRPHVSAARERVGTSCRREPRIDDLIARTTAEHAEIRTEIRRLDDWLRAVELAIKPAPPAE